MGRQPSCLDRTVRAKLGGADMQIPMAMFTTFVTSSLLWSGSPGPADAAVNFKSWPKDVVYVYDLTAGITANGSPVWPVRAAAERWDNDNPVDFRYTTYGCPRGVQCVTVRQAKLASPGVGTTTTVFVGDDIRSAKIVVDTTFGRTRSYSQRRNVICHELGHSLGLKHRTSTTSCLTSYVTSQRYPDATDIKNLRIMYGYR